MNLLNKDKPKEETAFMYTEEQLFARLKFFIGICLTLTLTGIVFVVLYSIIFVTQPLNAMSPIDQKFFELLIPISTFLTGILSGIMLAGNDKDAKMKAIEAATKPTPVSPNPSGSLSMGPMPANAAPRPFAPMTVNSSMGGASPFGPPPPPNLGPPPPNVPPGPPNIPPPPIV